jgi:hypothetical protein
MSADEIYLPADMETRTKLVSPGPAGNLVFNAQVVPTPVPVSSGNQTVDSSGVTYTVVVSTAASDYARSIRKLNDALAGRIADATDTSSGF